MQSTDKDSMDRGEANQTAFDSGGASQNIVPNVEVNQVAIDAR